MELSGFFSRHGKICSLAEATIEASASAVLFGEALTESICVMGKSPIDLELHWERLETSIENLGWTHPPKKESLFFEILSLVNFAKPSANSKMHLRILVYPAQSGCETLLYLVPANEIPKQWLEIGIHLKRKTLGSTNRGPQFKTNNYFATQLARKQSVATGKFDDILWSNSENEITEGSFSNIFFIGRDGDNVEIVTPPSSSGLLLGITRKRILLLLAKAKIRADEVTVYVDELPKFDEAFLCSSINGLIPIRSIDQQVYQTTRANSVFRHIDRLYSAFLTTCQ